MLLRHSGAYAAARGLPALVSLLTIAAFSRILSPEAYGRYALVLAGAGLGSALLFQWLRLCLLRFLPAHPETPERVLAPILSAFMTLVLLSAIGGGAAVLLIGDPIWRLLVALGLALVWAQGWFDLNRELARSRLSPLRYGVLSGTKAVLALALGALLVLAGLGAAGALLGVLAGLVAPTFAFGVGEWSGARLGRFRPRRHRHLLAYGLPLALNFVLVWVVASSDRLLVGWLLDVDAAGLYAVGYDLAQHSLGVVFTVVSLAAYPLAVRALEREGAAAAREQLEKSAGLLLGVGAPAAAGLALLAPGLAEILVGAEFRTAAARVIPWIALAAALAGIKAFHFDLAFQLGRRTMMQVWVSLAAAIVNLGLNLLWIPRYGVLGAAYATVVAYGVALAGSVVLGRSAFRIPWTWSTASRVGVATVLMAAAVAAALRTVEPGPVGLTIAMLLGVSVYGCAALALDVAGLRAPTRRWLRQAWATVG